MLGLGALLLALAAAVLHATWNLLIARQPDAEAATAVAFGAGALLLAPVGALTWDADAHVWPYLAASAALELAYMALLARAYARARATVVYPVARGSGPVLVLAGGALFAGTHVTALQVLGVVLVASGVLVLRGPNGDAQRAEVLWGLAVGVTIAGYTLVDDHGLDHSGAISYLAVVIGVPSALYALAIGRTTDLRPAVNAQTLVAGVASYGAYGLFLLALERAADAAPVAAVRETSVLIAALLAALLLKERLTLAGLAGAALVTAGIALLALV